MKIIGKGAFGVVYLHTMASTELAIKKENKVATFVCICIMLKYASFYIDSLSFVIRLYLNR